MESESIDIDIDVKIKNIGNKIVIQPNKSPLKGTLLWIHGHGGLAKKCVSLFFSPELIDLLKDFRIVLPQAPMGYSSFLKKEANIWYDIKTRNLQASFDDQFSRDDVIASQKMLTEILEEEVKLHNNDWKKIFIGGISSGGAMTYQVGFNLPHELGGLIGMATYLFSITPEAPDHAHVKIIHGTKDQLRPLEESKKVYEKLLEKKNVSLSVVEGMGHDWASPQSRELIYQFITKRISETQEASKSSL